MNPYNRTNTYAEMNVNTTNRLKLIVMVYDAAIGSLKQAKECHKRNDLINRNRHVSRTQFILSELDNALDMNRGKKIAETLRGIYNFLSRYLGDVLNDNDMSKVENSLKMLNTIRGAWHEISIGNSATIGPEDGSAVYTPSDELNKVKYRL